MVFHEFLGLEKSQPGRHLLISELPFQHRRLAPLFSKALFQALPSILHDWRSAAQLQDDIGSLLEIELLRCEDPDFAQGFANACPVDGCVANDYLQRVVEVDAEQFLLTGIRFHQLLKFAFVDILATTRPIDDTTSLGDALDAVRVAYAKFNPEAVRILRACEHQLCVPDNITASVDQYIVAGSLDLLAAQPWPAKTHSLRLEAVTDFSKAAAFVDSVYRAYFEEYPQFSNIINPADEEDLSDAQKSGGVFYILANGTRAGLIATAHDCGGLCGQGQQVVEEILSAEFRGRRLGSPAQRLVIDALAKTFPGELIWGTIDAANTASLATARSVGRQVLSAWHFLRWA